MNHVVPDVANEPPLVLGPDGPPLVQLDSETTALLFMIDGMANEIPFYGENDMPRLVPRLTNLLARRAARALVKQHLGKEAVLAKRRPVAKRRPLIGPRVPRRGIFGDPPGYVEPDEESEDEESSDEEESDSSSSSNGSNGGEQNRLVRRGRLNPDGGDDPPDGDGDDPPDGEGSGDDEGNDDAGDDDAGEDGNSAEQDVDSQGSSETTDGGSDDGPAVEGREVQPMGDNFRSNQESSEEMTDKLFGTDTYLPTEIRIAKQRAVRKRMDRALNRWPIWYRMMTQQLRGDSTTVHFRDSVGEQALRSFPTFAEFLDMDVDENGDEQFIATSSSEEGGEEEEGERESGTDEKRPCGSFYLNKDKGKAQSTTEDYRKGNDSPPGNQTSPSPHLVSSTSSTVPPISSRPLDALLDVATSRARPIISTSLEPRTAPTTTFSTTDAEADTSVTGGGRSGVEKLALDLSEEEQGQGEESCSTPASPYPVAHPTEAEQVANEAPPDDEPLVSEVSPASTPDASPSTQRSKRGVVRSLKNSNEEGAEGQIFELDPLFRKVRIRITSFNGEEIYTMPLPKDEEEEDEEEEDRKNGNEADAEGDTGGGRREADAEGDTGGGRKGTSSGRIEKDKDSSGKSSSKDGAEGKNQTAESSNRNGEIILDTSSFVDDLLRILEARTPKGPRRWLRKIVEPVSGKTLETEHRIAEYVKRGSSGATSPEFKQDEHGRLLLDLVEIRQARRILRPRYGNQVPAQDEGDDDDDIQSNSSADYSDDEHVLRRLRDPGELYLRGRGAEPAFNLNLFRMLFDDDSFNNLPRRESQADERDPFVGLGRRGSRVRNLVQRALQRNGHDREDDTLNRGEEEEGLEQEEAAPEEMGPAIEENEDQDSEDQDRAGEVGEDNAVVEDDGRAEVVSEGDHGGADARDAAAVGDDVSAGHDPPLSHESVTNASD
ncbi:unnamed protein product [Amoebophrya sp. A25]|nr:unnamed protein product [Amoebophrya sp. A25]|eukprot:GSA25T00004618001.1